MLTHHIVEIINQAFTICKPIAEDRIHQEGREWCVTGNRFIRLDKEGAYDRYYDQRGTLLFNVSLSAQTFLMRMYQTDKLQIQKLAILTTLTKEDQLLVVHADDDQLSWKVNTDVVHANKNNGPKNGEIGQSDSTSCKGARSCQ